MPKTSTIGILALAGIALMGAVWYALSPKIAAAPTYTNTDYGFNFSLPDAWRGYSVVTNTWSGYVPGATGDTVTEQGPLISLRHPKWTGETPRQDIPIMIFTTPQWDSLQQEKFHIGAAPLGPRELGRNARYVFALPARYNYAFPVGYEEVESILETNPLQPF